MNKEMILALAAVGQDEAERLSRQLDKQITVDMNALIMLARIAMHKTDGEEFMRTHVRLLAEDMIRRNPEARGYQYEYEPADADARRQAGHVPPGISFT